MSASALLLHRRRQARPKRALALLTLLLIVGSVVQLGLGAPSGSPRGGAVDRRGAGRRRSAAADGDS